MDANFALNCTLPGSSLSPPGELLLTLRLHFSPPFPLRFLDFVPPPTVLPALLTRETCRTISRVCALLFLPSLVVSSTGSTLTPSILRDSWQLVVAAGFTILMSAATAWVLARAFLKREDCRAFLPVQLAIAFPNSVAFPLLMMDSLCQQDTINRYESFYICTIQWNTML